VSFGVNACGVSPVKSDSRESDLTLLGFLRSNFVPMNASTSRPIWYLLTLHWLGLVGAALVTTAGISWLFVLPLQIRGHVDNPYAGIVVFLILPVIFFAGLALIPIGIYLGRRRVRKGLGEAAFDRKAALGRLAWFFGVTTVLNVIIGTQFTYRAVTHMETPQFCGQSCHVMHPEFAAHQSSPHCKLECVECHVAPGAAGWFASKTAGVRQLFEVMRSSYPRPIPSAMETNRLVPARQTCENCHWSQKFGSVRLRVISNYAEDEKNTRTETVLMMMVGGSKLAGIHGAHFGPGIHIRYAATDAKRQTIPWVEYKNSTTGKAQIFLSEGSTQDSVNNLPKYEMQCVDCHNRPTHTFELPERGLNNALAFGEIGVTLPFIKKKGLELLKTKYSSNKEASEKLPAALISFYQQNYPDLYARESQEVQGAAQAVLAIYNRNVFPDLKVDWGTYPNNLGHTDFPGCFRCHDGSHTTAAGNTITQDCNSCHQPLAMDEASPEILKTLGIEERISKVQKK
jgi:NapC/NirT cytochrome c family, N-terminal region